MTTILTFTTVLFALMAIALGCSARALYQRIAAQRIEIGLLTTRYDLFTTRCDLFTEAIRQSQERISLLVKHNGDLEDRNANLERCLKAKDYRMITSLPVMDAPAILRIARHINKN